MRTAAFEHLNQTQIMSRLGATFGALIHEQVAAVRRFLDDETNYDSSELLPIAELAIRLVERSAEWLEVGDIASLALEMREALAQLSHLRPSQRQEVVAQCRVALDAEERLIERLRAEGFAALVDHAGIVSEALERLRANLKESRSQEANSARGMIDDTPDVGSQENLLALTFEIKNSLIHQNERIGSMSETVNGSLDAAQAALTEWESVHKAVERTRMTKGRRSSDAASPLEGRSLIIHQKLQETTSGLRTVAHELNQLLGLQYSLERRARDLDEHLLWEFLDPLDRYLDDMYTAAHCGDRGHRIHLSVQTGGVGFEPEIGAILVPLIVRMLETMQPLPTAEEDLEVSVTAAREGLEARLRIEGPVSFDTEALRLLENALEILGGFVSHHEAPGVGTTLRLQFPMARSLRSFLIVEAGGQRIALPWSAIERIYASDADPAWNAADTPGRIHSLAALFGRDPSSSEPSRLDYGEAHGGDSPAKHSSEGHPLAVLRSGSGSAVVSFDRLVWRENARLKPLPPRLYPVEEVLGGIMTPDSGITLVLNPSVLLKRSHVTDNATGTDAS
jgi:chemotaxis protein histidine kinase CheA